MLAGGFYLAQRTPGLAAMLRDDEHCAFYDDAESCIEKCGYYLGLDSRREQIRLEGERFVRRHHTYDKRVANLLAGSPFVNPLES
jgi:spore maturation protein CgeB